MQIKAFEEGWLIHERQLEQYELTQAKFKDWDESTRNGRKVWVNKVEGTVSDTNPGICFFKQNRKTMRKAAELKLNETVFAKVEKELQMWQQRYEHASAEIESDVKRQTYFNLKKL